MRRYGICRDRQAGSNVIGQNGGPGQRRACGRRARIVYRSGADGDVDGGRRCLSGAVGGGVREGVEPRVVEGRGVHVGAVGCDGDRAVCRSSVDGCCEAGASVIRQDRRATQGNVRGRRAGVICCDRRHRQADGRSRGAARGVGCRVGE